VAQAQRSFDAQADSFDQQKGVPDAAGEAIARAVLGIARPSPADVLLEVGPGTGQIGHHLCALPVRYVGFDSSKEMLAVFERRCHASGRSASLIHADGRRRWPVGDRTVKAVFGSRVLHLLPVEHVVDEFLRVANRGAAALIVGRVQRAEDSVAGRMRRYMHELLEQGGSSGTDAQRHERLIMAALCGGGAVAFEPRVVASWPVQTSAAAVLDSWREKPDLGGVAVSAPVKATVLTQLERWAKETLGSLETVHSSNERYMLAGVRLPDQRGGMHEE